MVGAEQKIDRREEDGEGWNRGDGMRWERRGKKRRWRKRR